MTISPQALEARYREERAKRLRADGNDQYQELNGAFADFDRDGYADPDLSREPVAAETEVAIIGAGFGGLCAGARLVEQGVGDFRILDKAGDFGGTWYWNRYPGIACDVESYTYMPLLEETGYIPTQRYATGAEIFAHCQRIGRHYGLYPKALFQTVVQQVRWDDAASRWLVRTDRGDRLAARFVLISGGVLDKPKLPAIPGIGTFKGRSFHTSRWDYGYTGGGPGRPPDRLGDKRVAVIGTGCTAVQLVPALAEVAGHVDVFQRTPSAVGVRANRPTDPAWAASLKSGWQRPRIESFTRIVCGLPVAGDLIGDGWTEIFLKNPNPYSMTTEAQRLADLELMEGIRARVDSIVKDRATAEALKPWYHMLCKRPTFHDEYLDAFNRPNVTLVDTAGRGVDQVTETGLVVAGVEYPADCIVYASGFEVSTPYQRRLGFEIHGRGGVGLAEAWAEGPGTLHGLYARGFPNLIMFSTTQGGQAINYVHMLSEWAIHAAWFVRRCRDLGVAEVEPSAAAQDAWLQVLVASFDPAGAQFLAECTPGYYNAEGQARPDPAILRYLPYFGGTMPFIEILRAWRDAGDMAGLELRRIEAWEGAPT
jgi:cation diffusion facilitator CzcD-associated flavoprotein CzcO